MIKLKSIHQMNPSILWMCLRINRKKRKVILKEKIFNRKYLKRVQQPIRYYLKIFWDLRHQHFLIRMHPQPVVIIHPRCIMGITLKMVANKNRASQISINLQQLCIIQKREDRKHLQPFNKQKHKIWEALIIKSMPNSVIEYPNIISQTSYYL